MKLVTNWKKASVCDIETDGLLDTITKIHIVGIKLQGRDTIVIEGNNHDRIKAMLNYHIENQIPIVGHNFIAFDVPALEKVLGIDLKNLMVIDTLALSWYLNVGMKSHSIESLIKEYDTDVEKYILDEDAWEDLSWEDAVARVTSDVEANNIIWEDFKGRLKDMYSLAKREIDSGSVGGKRVSSEEELYIDSLRGASLEDHIDNILTFLMFKMDCVRLMESTRWKVDVEYLKESYKYLSQKLSEAAQQIESVMPKVPKYAKRTPPTRPYKKNGDLSAAGQRWEDLKSLLKSGEKDEYGNPKAEVREEGFIHELVSYAEPNVGSVQQVKDFLFSKGWKPETFKYIRDKSAMDEWVSNKPHKGATQKEWNEWKNAKPEDRAIPQISKDGEDGKELCDSVLRLSEEVPEVKALEDYSVIEHRHGIIKGFLERMSEDGYLSYRIAGYTNTLRMRHAAPLVNLPKAGRPYAESVRGSLIAGEGRVSIGSDMSGLEDRVKHHFMLAHDPDYVETMLEEDYDAHIHMALVAGLITKEEFNEYKRGIVNPHVKASRDKGKTVNYSCLPVDNTEVLTEYGWRRFHEIKTGDRVLSLNMGTGNTEFCSVSDTVFYENREVVTIEVGNNWKVESTPDHRWVIDKRSGRGKEKKVTRGYETTEKLNSETNIVTSAPYIGGNSLVTPEDAALIGWVLSDGYLDCSENTGRTSQGREGDRQFVSMSIAQSKYVEELEDVIRKVGLEHTVHERGDGLKVYKFSSPSARNFLSRVGLPIKNKHDIDYTRFILSLSRDSLKAFLNAFWLGDGQTIGERAKYSNKIIFQKSGNILDAVHLGYELMGMNCSRNERKSGVPITTMSARNRGHVTMQRARREFSRKTDVFCLTTENGNFVIRQGNTITITGNCVYGSGAAKVAQTLGVPLSEGKALVDGYWDLNWSVKAIAEEQIVVTCSKGLKWLVNPINGFLYNIRAEKDIFSTLAQGTGSYLFDMWVDAILTQMEEKWGVKSLTATFHDEVVIVCKDNSKVIGAIKDMINRSIDIVNEKYKLRRPLGCDIQVGQKYSDIH